MGAWQSADEVQVDGTEGSHRPVRTTTEDELLSDGQTGGLRRLETHRQMDGHAQRQGQEQHHVLHQCRNNTGAVDKTGWRRGPRELSKVYSSVSHSVGELLMNACFDMSNEEERQKVGLRYRPPS